VHQVLSSHFEEFVERAEEAGGLPEFVLTQLEHHERVLLLDPECQGEPPRKRCISLEPGTVLQPKAWSGFSCTGQCRQGYPDNHFMRGWPLRFVLSACDGQQQVASPPFRLQEYQDELASGDHAFNLHAGHRLSPL
jgi:hypothetical protein